jgi:hypothetical protein
MALTAVNLDHTVVTGDEQGLSDRLRATIGSDEQFTLSLTLIADALDEGIINSATAAIHIETVGKLALTLDEC